MSTPTCSEEVGVKKGPWTPEEDISLVSYIQEHGPGNWRAVPANTGDLGCLWCSSSISLVQLLTCPCVLCLPGLMRCSKSCRLRWTNYLRPGIKRGNFTDQENRIIIHLQALLGNRSNTMLTVSYTDLIWSLAALLCCSMQMGSHCLLSPSKNRQRYQESLEHPPEEEAQEGRSRRERPEAIHLPGEVGEESADWHPQGKASSVRGPVDREASGLRVGWLEQDGVRVERREHLPASRRPDRESSRGYRRSRRGVDDDTGRFGLIEPRNGQHIELRRVTAAIILSNAIFAVGVVVVWWDCCARVREPWQRTMLVVIGCRCSCSPKTVYEVARL